MIRKKIKIFYFKTISYRLPRSEAARLSYISSACFPANPDVSEARSLSHEAILETARSLFSSLTRIFRGQAKIPTQPGIYSKTHITRFRLEPFFENTSCFRFRSKSRTDVLTSATVPTPCYPTEKRRISGALMRRHREYHILFYPRVVDCRRGHRGLTVHHFSIDRGGCL